MEKTFLGHVLIKDGKIAAVREGPTAEKGIDGKKNYLMPAFWDTHTHGGYGFSFNELANWDEKSARNYLGRVVQEGVCAVLATAVTDSPERIREITKNYLKLKAIDKNDIVRGLYFEGPFISKIKKGAHDPALMAEPNAKNIQLVLGKHVKVITVTPEAGSKNVYAAIKTASKTASVAIGHSNASADQYLKAVQAGATRITHLYNAMTGYEHRSPGVVNGVFASKGMFIEMIADGMHVDPLVVNETIALLSKANQFVFVTDSLSLKGLPEGTKTRLGPVAVEKRGNFCYIQGTDTLAGSCVPYNHLVQTYQGYSKANAADIAKMTATNPALSIKEKKDGSITVGNRANLVLLNKKDFSLIKVIINGAEQPLSEKTKTAKTSKKPSVKNKSEKLKAKVL